jgi:response regulator RpfG family c-di-GMP phosphodiesterase
VNKRATETSVDELPPVATSGAPVVALIVHPDATARQACRDIVCNEGWSVIEAQTREEAEPDWRLNPPDVVITGLTCNGVDGLSFARHLRSEPATEDIPVIIIHNGVDVLDWEAISDAGVDTCIAIPRLNDELTLSLRSIARLHRSRIELSRGRSRLGEQTRALDLLLDFSAALARIEDLDMILKTTVDAAAALTSCRRISIMLPDSENRRLIIAASLGIEEHIVRNVSLQAGESIAGRVFQSGRAVVISDQQQAETLLDNRERRDLSGLPLLVTPLCASETIIGVLNITDRMTERPFDESAFSYLNLLTNYAASAIQNVRTREARDHARDSIVVALAKLAEHRDNDTGKHVERVTQYSIKLSEMLRKNPVYAVQIGHDFIRNLERAAPLHDIGKVAIPDAILLKPGKLSDAEMTIMKRHPTIGAETIRALLARTPDSGFLKMAEQIARSHHEWTDGTGYPQGLKDGDIPLPARILAIADVYDALTTKRVYKDAFAHRTSIEIILKESGTHFDPDVVKAFLMVETEFERLAKELKDQPGSDYQGRGFSSPQAAAASC